MTDSRTGVLRIWGTDPLIELDDRICDLKAPEKVVKILGMDDLIGYFTEEGHVYDLDGTQSAVKWDDIVVTGLNEAYAYSSESLSYYKVLLSSSVDGGIRIFENCRSIHG